MAKSSATICTSPYRWRDASAQGIHSATTLKSSGLKVRCLAEITWWRHSPRVDIRSPGSVHLAVASAPAEGPSMVLTPGSSITVHVVEQFTSNDWTGSGDWNVDGRPIPIHGPRLYLQISVESVDDFARGNSSLRPPSGSGDDALVLENLAPGRYWLRLHSARGYVASATMGGVDLLHEPFTVSPGQAHPSKSRCVTMLQNSKGRLPELAPRLTIQRVPGGFAPSAFVYCVPVPDSPGQFLELRASSDGKFDYRSVAPGTYRVLAFKNPQPNLPYRDAEAMKAFDAKGQVVRFSAGQKTTVQLQVISTNE